MSKPNWEGKIEFKFYTFEEREHAERFVKGITEAITTHPNVKDYSILLKELTFKEIKNKL